MPNLSVRFYAGTKAQYDALQQKDAGGLYFLTDKKTLYRGTEVISRYAVSSLPANQGEHGGIRITDLHTGSTYDIPLLTDVNGLVESELLLHYSEDIVKVDQDLVDSIHAEEGVPGTGEFLAGRVWRVESDGEQLKLNPGQFAKPDYLIANDHDLVISLYAHSHRDTPFRTNHEMFAVIPTDLVDLVSAYNTLDNGKIILGAGNHVVQAMPFGAAGKILAMNQAGNGVEWLSPETVQSDVVWEDIQ